MKKSTEFKLVIATAALVAGTAVSHAKDQIRTYSVPKTQPSVQKTAMKDTGGINVNASPVQWTTPNGWQELAPTSIRLGNLLIPGKDGKRAEVTITSFPGDVGGELSNVNRWRGELGLTPVQESDITSTPVSIGSLDAKLYDFASTQARTVVASLPREGSTWFFKMRGEKEVVTGAVDAFKEFLKSIRFEEKANANVAAAADPHAGIAGADPHAGIAGAPPLNATEEPHVGEPKWNIPANWKEKAAGTMVLKSFSVNVDGKDATIAISQFPGDVGGTFANVNRWRNQLGLASVSKDELPKYVTTLDVEDGQKATVVDFKNSDPKSGKAVRLLAVAVPHDGNTWFYKLLGDDAVIAHEKESFLKFVQTVRYH